MTFYVTGNKLQYLYYLLGKSSVEVIHRTFDLYWILLLLSSQKIRIQHDLHTFALCCFHLVARCVEVVDEKDFCIFKTCVIVTFGLRKSREFLLGLEAKSFGRSCTFIRYCVFGDFLRKRDPYELT